MPRGAGKQILLASSLLALPVLVIPTLFLAVNRASFVWSVIVLGLTGWKGWQARHRATEPHAPTKTALSKLAFTILLLQMLAFVWIGAVWTLQGLAWLVIQSPGASRLVRWIEAQWFAPALAWLVLLAVVCSLFRLARPIFTWHQRAVQNASQFLRKGIVSNVS